MLKIAHSADLHLNHKYRKDCLGSLEFIANKVIDGSYDIFIIAGDVWDNIVKLNHDSPLYKAVELVYKISKTVPVLFIYGNHDWQNSLQIFSSFPDSENRVYVAEERLETVVLEDSKLYNIKDLKDKTPTAVIHCLRYPYEWMWLTERDSGKGSKFVDIAIRKELVEVDKKINEKIKTPYYKIIAAHGSLEKFTQNEFQVERGLRADFHFSERTFNEINPDYVAMGHIHLRQTLLDGRACYPSSIYSINFGERDKKTFSSVTLDRDEGIFKNDPIYIPHRTRETIELTCSDDKDTLFFQSEIEKILKTCNLEKYTYEIILKAPRRILKGIKLHIPEEEIKIKREPTDKPKVIKKQDTIPEEPKKAIEFWIKNIKKIKYTPLMEKILTNVDDKLRKEGSI